MKRLFLGFLLGLICLTAANAEEKTNETSPKWEFYEAAPQPTSAELSAIVANTRFSKESEFLMNELKELIFTTEQTVPGDPMRRIIIQKGDLYKAVSAIQKGLKREMENRRTPATECSERLENVLKVAIAAFYSDNSESFENALRQNKKDYKQLLSIFENVKLKN